VVAARLPPVEGVLFLYPFYSVVNCRHFWSAGLADPSKWPLLFS